MNRMRYYLNFAKKESKISAETVKDTYDLAPCLSVLVDLFQCTSYKLSNFGKPSHIWIKRMAGNRKELRDHSNETFQPMSRKNGRLSTHS